MEIAALIPEAAFSGYLQMGPPDKGFITGSYGIATHPAIIVQAIQLDRDCPDTYELVPDSASEDPNQTQDDKHVIFVHGWQPFLADCPQWMSRFDLSTKGEVLFSHLNAYADAIIPKAAKYWRFTYPTFNSVNSAAARLAQEIGQLPTSDEVVLVGHSMGGLVARAAALDPAVRARTRRIITLGTPHAGTPLALIRRVSALSFIFSFLDTPGTEDLEKGLPGTSPVEVYAFRGIASTSDLIPPNCSAKTLCAVLVAGRQLFGITPSDGLVAEPSALGGGSTGELTFGLGYDHEELANGDRRGGASTSTDPLLLRVAQLVAEAFKLEVSDLGNLGGVSSGATDANDHGYVVGWSQVETGNRHAFLWNVTGKSMTDLGTLPGDEESFAEAINNAGQIVGWSFSPGRRRAVTWSVTGQATDLSDRLPCWESAALDVNERGEVLIIADSCSNTQRSVFVLSQGAAVNIGSLGGSFTNARRISDDGTVVGISQVCRGCTAARPFIWTSAQGMQQLSFAGTVVQPNAINTSGLIVGGLDASGHSLRFFFAQRDGQPDYSCGAGPGRSEAHAINELGIIVGEFSPLFSQPAIKRALLCDQSRTSRELSPVQGFSHSVALQLNNAGLAVGESYNNVLGTRTSRATVWRVP